MKDAAERVRGQRTQTLKSMVEGDTGASPPPAEEDLSHPAFWADLGEGAFDPLTLQGQEPQSFVSTAVARAFRPRQSCVTSP